MLKKVTMKRFIYFFVFFLFLTLGLFYVLHSLGARTVQESLIQASKNQIDYADSVLEGIISEASTYAVQFTDDDSVRYYQSQKRDLNAYDAQMLKNDIFNKLMDPLISSPSIDMIGIYWKSGHEFISTSHDLKAKDPFDQVTSRGWKTVNGSLYYFSIYPYIGQSAGTSAAIQYIVGVKLNTENLTGILNKAFNGSNSNAFFLVNKSLVLSRKPVNPAIERKAMESLPPIADEVVRQDYRTGDGSYYLLSKFAGAIDTYLVTYTKTNAFLRPLERIQQVFFASMFVILIIGLVVIAVFYRNFYRNVYLLNKKFNQVEQGNYGTRISANPVNEFSSLFKSFNHMVAEIQALFASLKVETELRRNAEVKQLQAQINPHFLYNSLFFIMSMARTSPEAVMQMSKHLAEYYRYLTKKDSQHITLGSELELADHYLFIMSLSKEVDYEIHLPPGLGERSMMPLLIQPIVENAIQHGIEERQGAHRVSIDVREHDTGALITIANDGKGLSDHEMRRLAASVGYEQPPEGSNGFGLWNINRRLRNTYGERSGLRFETNGWGGLTVSFFIDFSLDEGGRHALINCG